jgi:myosin heavy subunit
MLCSKVTTVGEKFRQQLTKLMGTVGQTRPFFIRCAKPNHAERL